jgi:hypothetical protein
MIQISTPLNPFGSGNNQMLANGLWPMLSNRQFGFKVQTWIP